jgi:DNA-directed RNA polymerase specialized sigma24 family protein
VIMHELEGLSLSTIASFLGISGMTVRWHLSMGRRDLKRVLARHMGDTI